MHPAAMRGFLGNLNAISRPLGGFNSVLDLGGQDVNGTVHEALHRRLILETLDVLDIAAGPGVTIVADARTWRPEDKRYDLVISTECLEHVQDWHMIIETAYDCLRPGGWFVGTAASLGRLPHGATGAPSPAKGEYYSNVSTDALVAELYDFFSYVHVEYERDPAQPTTHDVYWRAQR